MIKIYKYCGASSHHWHHVAINERSQIIVGDTLSEMLEDNFSGYYDETDSAVSGYRLILQCETIKDAKYQLTDKYPEELI